MRKTLALLLVLTVTGPSCANDDGIVVDGGVVTEDGWPQREAETALRCPENTSLVDQTAPSGRRTITCMPADESRPRGFEANWSAEGSLTSITRFDEEGYPVDATYWHENGEKRSQEAFEKGELVHRVEWYSNGKKKSELSYDPERGWTRLTQWQPDGTIEAKGSLQHGTRTGKWTEWRDGALTELTYVAGKPQGPVRRAYPGGSVEEGMYSEGRKTGRWVQYDDRGRKTMAVTYRNGEKDGPYRIWHPNLQLRLEGRFSNGKKLGEWTTWYPNGRKQSHGQYACGEKIGWWTSWYPGGERETKGFYWYDQLVGEWREWSEGGVVARVRSYRVPEELAEKEEFSAPELPEECPAPGSESGPKSGSESDSEASDG